MRTQLASSVAVRRDPTTLPGEVPLQSQNEWIAGSEAEQATDEGLVSVPMKLRDEIPPGLRQRQARVVVQDVPVMIALPIGTFHGDLAIEQRHIGEGRAELFEAVLCQCALNVNPGIGLFLLERLGRDPLDTAAI